MWSRIAVTSALVVAALASACDSSQGPGAQGSKSRPSTAPGGTTPAPGATDRAGPSTPRGLANGDFERGLDGWVPFGQNVHVAPAGAGKGTQALKLFRDFGTDEPHAAGVYQDVVVEAGGTYVLGANVRDGDGDGDFLDAAGTIALDVRWFGAGDVEIDAPSGTPRCRYRGGAATDKSWHWCATYVDAPKKATKARITVAYAYERVEGGAGKGSAWIEEVLFRLTPANILRNGDFEGDLTSWTKFGENAVVERYAPIAGDKSLKLFRTYGKDVGDHANGVVQEIAVTAGAAYLLSGRSRDGTDAGDRLEEGTQARIRVEWLEGNSKVIDTIELAGLAVGFGGLIAAQVQAPPRATSAKVAVLVHYRGDGKGGGSAWFDDLRFGLLGP